MSRCGLWAARDFAASYPRPLQEEVTPCHRSVSQTRLRDEIVDDDSHVGTGDDHGSTRQIRNVDRRKGSELRLEELEHP